MGVASDDDEMHVHATMLPSVHAPAAAAATTSSTDTTTVASTITSVESEPTAASTRASANPFVTAPAANATAPQWTPPPAAATQPKTHMVLPAAAATPEGDEFIRVSEHCNATRSLRLQWEAESACLCVAFSRVSNPTEWRVCAFHSLTLLGFGFASLLLARSEPAVLGKDVDHEQRPRVHL